MEEKKVKVKIFGIMEEDFEFAKDRFKNFEELVEFLREKTKGGVLVKIVINDREIPMRFYDDIKTSYFEGGEVIELFFDKPKKVLRTLLKEGRSYIDKLKGLLSNASKTILLNPEKSGEVLTPLLEGLQALNTIAFQAQKFLNIQLADQEKYNKVLDVLKVIQEDFENKDYAGVSDTINFDLMEILDIYSDIFDKAISYLEELEENKEG